MPGVLAMISPTPFSSGLSMRTSEVSNGTPTLSKSTSSAVCTV